MKNMRLSEEKMEKAVHMLLKDDEEFKKEFIKDMTEEEYREFLEECPEFLTDSE